MYFVFLAGFWSRGIRNTGWRQIDRLCSAHHQLNWCFRSWDRDLPKRCEFFCFFFWMGGGAYLNIHRDFDFFFSTAGKKTRTAKETHRSMGHFFEWAWSTTGSWITQKTTPKKKKMFTVYLFAVCEDVQPLFGFFGFCFPPIVGRICTISTNTIWTFNNGLVFSKTTECALLNFFFLLSYDVWFQLTSSPGKLQKKESKYLKTSYGSHA